MAGGNLTPRQKMINMMYIVLTAMLALNVSAEVLDAFVSIDKSIEHNIEIAARKNQAAMDAFRVAASENAEKVGAWLQRAERVAAASAELYNYIQQLKRDLVLSGDGEDSEALNPDDHAVKAENIASLSETDAASRILIGDGNGKAYELREKLSTYREYLLSEMDATKGGSSAQQSVEELLKTEDGISADGDARSWEVGLFSDVPLISAVAILSKLQLDVYNTEGEVVSYLAQAVNAGDFKFSAIDVAIIPSSNYVIQGTEYSAEIFLAAYDPTQRPVLRLGGRTYPANEKGKIIFKTTPDKVGAVNMPGTIEFIGPEGVTTRPMQLSYQVVEPNAVISPTKMNVVYRGIDNPVNISVSGVPQDQLKVDVTNGSLTPQGLSFNLRPGAGRVCDITVTSNGKNMGTQTLRVKDLPPPTPQLDGITLKTATKGELLASQGIRAEMPRDFDFDLKYRVVSYTASATIDGYNVDEPAQSNLFGEQQHRLFNRLRAGQRVVFTDIKAVGPDGKTVDLLDLSIKIK